MVTASAANNRHTYAVDERLYARQRALTEKALFDYAMISSCCEDEVQSPFPYYMEKKYFDAFIQTAVTLNGVVCRLIRALPTLGDDLSKVFGSFPGLTDVMNLKSTIQPFFWVRFDGFIRENGGIFYSEFNYDKPCAQRETLLSGQLLPTGNPSSGFLEAFRQNFSKICAALPSSGRTLCAILVTPGHDEELHLAHLYMDMLHDLPVDFCIAGPDNIVVTDEQVLVFGRHVDLLLRQYPVEQLHQISSYQKLLQLHDRGLVQIMNDPRAIFGQAKSLFALLWQMAEAHDPFLSEKERLTILKTLPRTTMFDPAQAEALKANRKQYVIKAVYSRYSEQVYIGEMMTDDAWSDRIATVAKSTEPYIVQEFCKMRRERRLYYDGETYVEAPVYGNFGIYLSSSAYCGISARWSPDYLSRDTSVFISPVAVKKEPLLFPQYLRGSQRDACFRAVNDTAAFTYGFTGGYTGSQRSFSLTPLVLSSQDFEQVKLLTEGFGRLFVKTMRFVKKNADPFFDLLGIPAPLHRLILQSPVEEIFLGRFDWVYDEEGRLKLLEFNAETPAGVTEAAQLSETILDGLNRQYGGGLPLSNPCENLRDHIQNQFERIIKLNIDASHKAVRKIGVVSCAEEEDWYNTGSILQFVSSLPYTFLRGELAGLAAGRNGLRLGGEAIDCVYCYYPHDWFPYAQSTGLLPRGIIPAFSKTFGIIPPISIIAQSKALFALIWELRRTDFYAPQEQTLIDRHMPFTALQPDAFPHGDTCVKPYFGREGENVDFSYRINGGQEDVIYQQRIEIGRVPFLTEGSRAVMESAYPIIGAFITGAGNFAGIYTRLGARVTDKRAVYAPTYIQQRRPTGKGRDDR